MTLRKGQLYQVQGIYRIFKLFKNKFTDFFLRETKIAKKKKRSLLCVFSQNFLLLNLHWCKGQKPNYTFLLLETREQLTYHSDSSIREIAECPETVLHKSVALMTELHAQSLHTTCKVLTHGLRVKNLFIIRQNTHSSKKFLRQCSSQKKIIG